MFEDTLSKASDQLKIMDTMSYVLKVLNKKNAQKN